MTSPTPVLDADFVADALGDALRDRCGDANREFTRAIVDSRLAAPGDLFVALAGEQVDGHEFALDAVNRGATGLLLSRPVEGITGIRAHDGGAVACFYVEDALAAMQRVGAAWRRTLPSIEVVGITGNVGKTTTKGFTAALLAGRYRTQASEGSFNNEIGVPVTLLGLRPDTERAVIEMGMYTTGEIAQLCVWALPRIGVVLNVGPVHLERAGSLDAIVRAKRELVEALPEEGVAILNADDEAVRGMASHTAARVWTFGSRTPASEVDLYGGNVVSHGAEGFEFTLTAAGESRRVHISIPGAHLVSNALAAASVGLNSGMSFEEVVAGLEALRDSPRLRVVQLRSGATLLDDTYNANPASMAVALDLLGEMPGRKIALLGDMRELGPLADEAHERIGRRAAEVTDVLYTVGDLARRMSDAARAAGLDRTQHLESRELAIDMLNAALRAGDTVLVKGSRALGLEVVVQALEHGNGRGRDS